MSKTGDDGEPPASEQGGPVAPRDLIDFYRRWAEFRPTAVRLAQCSDLSALEQQTIDWMIVLVDRIGEGDLQP